MWIRLFFERLITNCLRNHYGDALDIIHVGGRKDRGIGLILINVANEKMLVQLKKRKNRFRAESVSVVRELNGQRYGNFNGK